MKKLASAALLLCLSALLAQPALAQTSPNMIHGQVYTPAQWNQFFIDKQDTLGYAPVNKAGDIMVGRLVTAAPSSTTSGFNLTCGSAPASPANGDQWCTTAGLFVRINGATVGPLIGSSSSNFTATSPIVVTFPSAGVTNYAFDTSVSNTFQAQQTINGASAASPAWNVNIPGDTSARVRAGLNSANVASIGLGPGTSALDAFIERVGAGSFRLGAPDAASPVNQQVGVQNVVAGTSNAAGANFNVAASRGTGTGAGGAVTFLVAPAGSSGSSQNTLVNAFTIFSTTGIVAGSATGGDQGAGKINAKGLFVDGVAAASSATAVTGLSGDVTAAGPGTVAATLATVNSNVGTFGSATQASQVTVNAKGLVTAASNVTVTPAVGSVTGLGTGVSTALGINVGLFGSFVTMNGVLGTPSSGTATNLTGLPTTGLTGTLQAAQEPAHTGDVTNTAGSLALAIGAGKVTNAMQAATMGAYTWKCNNTSGSASPTDCDTTAFTLKASPGASDIVLIQDASASNAYKRTTVGAIGAVGTVATVFSRSGTVTAQADDYANLTGLAAKNCTLAASATSNNLTISLVDAAGITPSATSPCVVTFRSATASTGTTTSRVVTSATTLTFNSGSSLGTSNNIPFKIWVEAIDTGSTAVLAASVQSNTTTIFPFPTFSVVSSTACSSCASATSAGVFYSVAAQTAKPWLPLGFLEWSSGLAAAGTWASGPTTIQPYGEGIPLPGQPMSNAAQGSTSTVATNTSTTYAAVTGCSATLSPQLASNIVSVSWKTEIIVGTLSEVGAVALIRSGTVIGKPSIANGTATNTFNLGGQTWTDATGSTGSATWTVNVREVAGSSGISAPNNNGGCSVTVQEVMG